VLANAPDAVILATGSDLRPSAALPGAGAGDRRRRVAEGFTVEIAATHPVVGAEIDPTRQPLVLRRLALTGVGSPA
jgi:hypothetical protein